MMAFQKILYHFKGLILLSNISIIIIGVSLIGMAIAALFFIFFKSKFYEKYMPLVGITIRVLLFIGFTLEFAHHTKISPLLGTDVFVGDGKEYTITQLSNYLLYSYVFVVGIYDILTIGINKFRGFFHSFDIAMVSLPLLYTLTAAVIYIPRSSRFEFIDLLIIVLMILMLLMIYLFFQLYWKQNTKWYVIFFIVTLPVVAVIAFSQFKYPHVLPIFLLLLGAYEVLRKYVSHIKAMKSEKTWRRLTYSSVVFLLIIMLLGLNFSGFSVFKGSDNYTAEMLFNKEVKLITLQEAEKTARAALDDSKNRFVLTSGASMDFYNDFQAILGEYSISVSEVTGKVQQINYRDYKKAHSGSTTISEIKTKTIELLKKCGYTYKEEKTDINIEEKKDFYEVNVRNKFSNGKSNNSDGDTVLGISWFKNGELSHMCVAECILNLRDYKEIKIDEAAIEKSVKRWYESLGEKTPNYALGRYNGFVSYSSKYSTLSIVCDNGNWLELDVEDGTVRGFDKDRGNNGQLSRELYEKYKNKAVDLANKIFPSSDGNKYEMDEKYGQSFYFLSRSEKGMEEHINIYLDNDGNLKGFNEFSNVRFSSYSGKDMSISKNKALSLVENKYKAFGIYSDRTKLIKELQPTGETKLKWMVIVIPYMSREHHIYFVDANTGEISALQNYKEGLK